jgi:hypothetical protein
VSEGEFQPASLLQTTTHRKQFWRSPSLTLRVGVKDLHVGLRLGSAFGLTYWMCNYWGLFLALILIPASVTLWNRQLITIAFWRDVLVAAVVSGVMIVPIAVIQRSLAKEHDWKRDSGTIISLSAHPRDLTDTPWPGLIPRLEYPEETRSDVWPLGGGGLKLGLAPVGLIAALMTRGRRRWGLFAAAFGLIAFGLSLGPNSRFVEGMPWGLAQQSPYEWLRQFVPGFNLIRSPFRFAMFAQLATAWLSVEALSLLDPTRWYSLPSASHAPRVEEQNEADRAAMTSWRNWLCHIPLLALSLLVTAEVTPPKQTLYTCCSPSNLPVWVLWMRDVAPSHEPIACLPFPTGVNVGNYQETTEWMYWSTFHRHPLLNGYSGFFPLKFLEIKWALEEFDRNGAREVDGIVQPELKRYAANNLGLARLNDSGVEYVVVTRSFATRDDVWMHPATKFRWAWISGDEAAQIDIYQVLPPLKE